MKRILLLLACLTALASCKGTSVPFTHVERYFFKNGQEIPQNPKIIHTAEEFETLFGMAAVMSEERKPTPIDWAHEFVIAVVNPVTDSNTVLAPMFLVQKGRKLVFTYAEIVGEKTTWKEQPILLIKVDRKYEDAPVRLERRVLNREQN